MVSVVPYQLLLLVCDLWKALALELGSDVSGCKGIKSIRNILQYHKQGNFMKMFTLTRILPISDHTLFSEQLPCQHTFASSLLASFCTSQLYILKHLSEISFTLLLKQVNTQIWWVNIYIRIHLDEACNLYHLYTFMYTCVCLWLVIQWNESEAIHCMIILVMKQKNVIDHH